MDLSFNTQLAVAYKSKSQIARVLSEDWVLHNSYCPSCGNSQLSEFENNRPVADFICNACNEEFELKSKNGKLTNSIIDGSYSTMIDRIQSDNNPNCFILTYSNTLTVNDFLIIPKQFFTPEIITKRPPLSITARRSGWIGCNIDISKVVEDGKVFLIKNTKIINREIVQETFKRTLFLRGKSSELKGWIIDIMKCIDSIDAESFQLKDVYNFEAFLKKKHPNNNFIKDKIRQQLQVLRDNGVIEFSSRGNYKKVRLK